MLCMGGETSKGSRTTVVRNMRNWPLLRPSSQNAAPSGAAGRREQANADPGRVAVDHCAEEAPCWITSFSPPQI